MYNKMVQQLLEESFAPEPAEELREGRIAELLHHAHGLVDHRRAINERQAEHDQATNRRKQQLV